MIDQASGQRSAYEHYRSVTNSAVSTEYLSNVACNGQEVKSVVVSRGVRYCTESDLVLPFFVPRLSVVFAIISMCMGSFVGKV